MVLQQYIGIALLAVLSVVMYLLWLQGRRVNHKLLLGEWERLDDAQRAHPIDRFLWIRYAHQQLRIRWIRTVAVRDQSKIESPINWYAVSCNDGPSQTLALIHVRDSDGVFLLVKSQAALTASRFEPTLHRVERHSLESELGKQWSFWQSSVSPTSRSQISQVHAIAQLIEAELGQYKLDAIERHGDMALIAFFSFLRAHEMQAIEQAASYSMLDSFDNN